MLGPPVEHKLIRGTSYLMLVPHHGVQMPLTVGQLAKRFGLSRSTLLYYDRIGLLRPAGRTESNYRLYSNSDVERLNPEAHEEFLTSLGIPHEEVGEIRKRSRSR